MGTSKGYKMPSGGDWGPLKREATDFVQNVGVNPVDPQSLVHHYVRVQSGGGKGSGNGGGLSSAGGGTGGGSGGAGRSAWRAGVGTAQKLGGFFSRVREVGLDEALRESGLGDLVGKPASEICVALLDQLAGPGSTLDQKAAREALVQLNDEFLLQAKTAEELEATFNQVIDKGGIFEVLVRFFGHYLYSCFCRDFYERFLKKVGESRAAQSLKSVKDCIQASVKAKLSGHDPNTFQWKGSEGKRLSEKVLGEVLEIYEVSE